MDSRGKATEQITKGMGAMIDSFAVFGRIHKGRQGPRRGNRLDYDRGASELRRNELVCVAAGYSLLGDKLLKQLKFPEELRRKLLRG